ncbi:MAG: lipopolysaccharide heptosyltransferase II [Desulfobacteraceae bacterium]|nr:lipopolysaccharide heptosyltransferase II [Desulfobacteraceae bacterium]
MTFKQMNPAKILIRSTNWIGDAVMTTPAVHTIRENFPNAEITMLAMPWVADIFRLSPDVDKVLVYDKNDLYPGRIKGVLKLANDLKQYRFDAAILLQNAFEAAFLVWMAGIPLRAGYKRDGRGLLLTHGVELTPEIRARHQVHYYQMILAGLGLDLGPDKLRLPLSDELTGWARGYIECLKGQGPFSTQDGKTHPERISPAENRDTSETAIPVIGFNPGAAYGPAKRWPAEKFGQLAALIAHHYGERGCLILVFGTKDDTDAARAIKEFSVRTPYHVIDMTAKTTLQQVMALIQCCNAFVTNDSGLMHVAAGLETPTIAIFGSTDHVATGPFSERAVVIRKEMDCSPCLQSECPRKHLHCLEEISSQEVYTEVAKALSDCSGNFLPQGEGI